MSIVARHVKRKQLSVYLDADFLKRERKSMENHNNFNNSMMAKRKRLSSELAQSQEQVPPTNPRGRDSGNKVQRLSESVNSS